MNTMNRLSDRDMLLDLLTTEKYLSHLYDHAILESSTSNVQKTFEQLVQDAHDTSRTLFTVMQERGWYNVKRTADKADKEVHTRKSIQEETFGLSADRDYAVTSRRRKLGRRLGYRRMGKTGVFTCGPKIHTSMLEEQDRH
ncbi:spore coat protein [Thermosinus carboxydivorans]|uniref:spore coat protein n=1 Tax=Thermosinus carboxydivorans TaxID=261685 RepID=UPI0018DB3C2E|nr:spore coat protein [Thermosinus carboxydivorans]